MNSRKRVGDRRGRQRFEVVGDLWGTLEMIQPLPILNISAGGALVECERAWAVGSVHAVLVRNGREMGRAQICVRHVRPVDQHGAERYHAGVEFLSVSPVLAAEIARWTGLDACAVEES